LTMKINKHNSNGIIDKFIEDVTNARQTSSLICVIGAGVSISQGYPDWTHYVQGLIDYWRFNLKTLTSDTETLLSKVELSDTLFLEWLRDAGLSNKRKVDLVNFIVKKYCKSSNPKKSLDIYNKHYLDCERYIFSEAEPLVHENVILNELVKLGNVFVTTNYDEEVEKSYRTVLGMVPSTISDVKSIPDSLSSGMVLHLHGDPAIQGSTVISSSESYTNLYWRIL